VFVDQTTSEEARQALVQMIRLPGWPANRTGLAGTENGLGGTGNSPDNPARMLGHSASVMALPSSTPTRTRIRALGPIARGLPVIDENEKKRGSK
jgi:hypothetical protein